MKTLKSVIAILLAFSLMLSATVFSSVADSSTALYGWSGVDGNYSISGTTVTVNKNGKNNFVVSDVSVNDFIFEADVTTQAQVVSNAACFGLAFGIGDRDLVDRAQTGWPTDFIQFHIQLDSASTPTLRLFSDGTGKFSEKRTLKEYKPTNRIRVEVIDNKITASVNGVVYISDYVTSKYNGGYLGFATYNADATFSNIKFINLDDYKLDSNTGWTENTSLGGYTVDDTAGSFTQGYINNRNNFLSTSTLTLPLNYTIEADITLDKADNQSVAGFMLCVDNADMQSSVWSNKHFAITVQDTGSIRLFNLGTDETIPLENVNKGTGATNNLKIQVNGANIKVWVNGEFVTEKEIEVLATRTQRNFGLLSYDATVTYSNLKYIPEIYTTLDNYYGAEGKSTIVEAEDKIMLTKNSGNNYLVSSNYMNSFEMQADISITKTNQPGGFIFGAQTNDCTKLGTNWLAVHVKGNSVRLFHEANRSSTGLDTTISNLSHGATANLRLLVEGTRIRVYINGVLRIDTTYAGYTGGYVGFCDYSNTTTFTNVSVKEINTEVVEDTEPELESIAISGVALNQPFDPAVKTYIAQVNYNTNSIEVSATASEGNKIHINGALCEEGKKTISLSVGYNKITINALSQSGTKQVTYYLVVRRVCDPETVYNETERPQIHYTAQQNWINDPNGLVYNAYMDEYHLFYQFNPYGNAWGHMSWGHAVSKDLVNWEELPVALLEDDDGMKWSGCAVIDKNNTSGLFDESVDPDNRMVFFISNYMSGSYLQLAYSTDGGRTLKYYNDGKSILNSQDPKVVWHEESERWLLINTYGRLYYSEDLINWTEGGRTYQQSGSNFPYWECQDIYPLAVDGDPDNIKWVYNGAGSWYTVGRLEWSGNSYNYYAETPAILYTGESYQANGGLCEGLGDQTVYATQSFFNDKDGRRIAISWVKEINGTSNKWNGAQTVAHEQTLKKTEDGYVLYTYPVEELEDNRLNPITHLSNVTVGEATANILENTNLLIGDVEAEITLGADTTEVGFMLRSDGTNYIKVYYDVLNAKLVVDKTQSGSSYIGSLGNPEMPMSVMDGNKIKFRILIDNGVLEFFGNDGEAAIISMANPLQNGGISFYVKGADVTINDLTVYSMQSIWFDKPENGDLNTDGIVDICDMVKHDLFVRDRTIAVKNACDFNKDKLIDFNDTHILGKYIIGAINTLLK